MQNASYGAPRGRVLVIAGSDCSGGAGIQADLKTITALGAYGMTAITALTVQDTKGVFGVQHTEPDILTGQIRVCLSDIGADVVKTGMLGDADMVHCAADALAGFTGPLVIDPVMVATSGATLADDKAVDALKDRLIPGAEVVTPNIPEAEILTGVRIKTPDDMLRAATSLLTLGPQAVVMKGGHLAGDVVTDLLVTRDGGEGIESERLNSRHTHGTGCSFASAIAAFLSKGDGLADAFALAHRFVHEAIHHAPGFGGGHGPLGHAAAGRIVMDVVGDRERPFGAVPFETRADREGEPVD